MKIEPERKGAALWLHGEYETVDGGKTWTLILRHTNLTGERYLKAKSSWEKFPYMPIDGIDKGNHAISAWHSRPITSDMIRNKKDAFGKNTLSGINELFEIVMPIKRTLIPWQMTEAELNKELEILV